MIISSVRHLLVRLRRDERGGILVLVALLFPILTGLSAVAIDYASLVKRRAELQRAAETEAELATLRATGIELFQGSLFAKPAVASLPVAWFPQPDDVGSSPTLAATAAISAHAA
ncbi:hypothetical protein ASF58_22535 [Methylobacterium sp. Leaf125]|uniref:TadE/TadG family type IV pilus assembly protein n=1 Tax=Methylobacterium sp. Leaf125 TaxID=1736265 RepID=UPI0006F9445A|nr:pilus assembly protein TadG-related protein [Methylobacterium sp. Leaf125]KQQ39274.1 hypothetical protein ASF58_22535 [Methylobacterium sp. Leaf125]